MVDGLRLTIPGEELRRLLEGRIDRHRRRAEWWKREQARKPEDQTEDAPLLPEHMCENEAERHQWRIEVLAFVLDHVDRGEVYRLTEADLAFGELLPERPGWMDQEDHEERNGIRFHLERVTRAVGEFTPVAFAIASKQLDCEAV